MKVIYNNRTGCIVICKEPEKTEGGNLGDSMENLQQTYNYCGKGFVEAMDNCKSASISCLDVPCPDGQECYNLTDTMCPPNSYP